MGQRTAQSRDDALHVKNEDIASLSHRSDGCAVSKLWRWVLLLTLVVSGVAAATSVSYVYDSNGRLTAVTNTAGDSSRYVYDAMGNLLRIESVPAGQLAIFAFSPNHGAPGATVAISGHGFSATPSQNTVLFNGVAAVVTAATTTKLTTAIPAAATTGSLSVTVGTQSATGASAFVVDNTNQPPIINANGVTPLIGSVGTSITANGTHLYPVPSQTQAFLNGQVSLPTAATDGQVTFPVPANAGSGKVSITTPYGLAQSVEDFVVTPLGVLAANVSLEQRVTADSPGTSITVPSGQYAALLFDVTRGNWYSFQISDITTSASNIAYTVYDSKNRPILTGSISSASPSIHLPKISDTGTYSIWVRPNTAAASMTLRLKTDINLTPGTASSFATNAVNQTIRVLFNVAADKAVGLAMSDLHVNPGWTNVDIYDDDNNFEYNAQCSPGPTPCPLFTDLLSYLPTIGSYQVIVTPTQSATMNFAMTLSQNVAAILQPNVPQSFNLLLPGQNGTATFSGASGQDVVLDMLNQSTNGGYAWYALYGPDGAQVDYWVSYNGAWDEHSLTLPQTGTYTVLIDPRGENPATLQLELIPNLMADLPIDVSSHFTTSTQGQHATLDFTIPAGDDRLLTISGSTSGPIRILGISGYPVSCSSGSTCYVELPILPVATAYSATITPDSPQTMDFSAVVAPNPTVSLPPNVPENLSFHGYKCPCGIAKFVGTAGELATIHILHQTDDSFDTYKSVGYDIYGPDGNELYHDSYGTTDPNAPYTIQLPTLPISGTYTIVASDSAASVYVTLQLVPQ